MKAWRFYAFGDMRLDDIELAACPPDHVLVEPLVVQPSATEAQLAFGIPTLAYDHIKSRLETDAPLQLFGHEFCARIVEVGSAVTDYAPGDRVAARAKLPCGDCSHMPLPAQRRLPPRPDHRLPTARLLCRARPAPGHRAGQGR